MTRLRFAVSPAAPLHVASARLAVVSWLYAKCTGGRFLLRVDDIAAPSEAADLQRDLAWLGIDWFEIAFQSHRRDAYADAAEKLKAAGRLYPCFETQQELEAKRDHRARRGQPVVYDRAMLKLTPDQRARAEAGGKQPHWRFQLSDRTVTWKDLTLGKHEEKLQAISDPVLIRADGSPTPALAAAVDDHDDRITHVIRGAEQTASTAVQIDILAALGAKTPFLAHLPPLQEGTGRRARRPEGIALRHLRADGMEPQALAAYLATLGTGHPATAAGMTSCDLARFAPARFDIAALLAANRAQLSEMPHEAAAARLPPGATEAFWLCVRKHIDLLPEARGWWDVVAGEIVPPEIEGEAGLLRLAAEELPAEPWNEQVWPTWRDALATATNRPAPDIAQILRLALTGEDHGPDMASLLPLIGRARAKRRLDVAAC